MMNISLPYVSSTDYAIGKKWHKIKIYTFNNTYYCGQGHKMKNKISWLRPLKRNKLFVIFIFYKYEERNEKNILILKYIKIFF